MDYSPESAIIIAHESLLEILGRRGFPRIKQCATILPWFPAKMRQSHLLILVSYSGFE